MNMFVENQSLFFICPTLYIENLRLETPKQQKLVRHMYAYFYGYMPIITGLGLPKRLVYAIIT